MSNVMFNGITGNNIIIMELKNTDSMQILTIESFVCLVDLC